MTSSMLLLCTAASAMIALAGSALVGCILFFFRGSLNRLTPAAEARVLLGAALFPMLACGAIMIAALAPSFGWIIDHCTQGLQVHSHPHICTAHHVNILPAATVLVFAGFLWIRLAVSGARLLAGSITALLTRRALSTLALANAEAGVQVLPLDEPQAFVVGALNPCVFVTRGLFSEAHREYLAPVLCHERAHIRRKDPLRRALAAMGLAFHVPGIARWIEQRLARAHEMAADADAADETGSRELVARALVCLTRAHLQVPTAAMAFGQSNIEARVAALLDLRSRHDHPRFATLIAGFVLLFVMIGASADTVHHGVEIVLGLING